MSIVSVFLALAFVQNLVLNTGIGSTLLVYTAKRSRLTLLFSVWMTVFSLLTVITVYPLDRLIGTDMVAKWCRPLMIIAVTTVWFWLVTAVLKRKFSEKYSILSRILPLAAFNNVVVGIALIVNHQFSLSFFGAIAMSLGACVGFYLLALLTAEGMRRLDNPSVPKAFRGLPSVLLYLGVLALALMGFTGSMPLL